MRSYLYKQVIILLKKYIYIGKFISRKLLRLVNNSDVYVIQLAARSVHKFNVTAIKNRGFNSYFTRYTLIIDDIK